MLLIYPRAQKMDGGVEGGARWTSKYGSVGCSIIGYAKKYGYDYVKDGHTERVAVEGRILPLKGRILHDDRKPLSRWLRVQDRYQVLEADKLRTGDTAHLYLPDRIRNLIQAYAGSPDETLRHASFRCANTSDRLMDAWVSGIHRGSEIPDIRPLDRSVDNLQLGLLRAYLRNHE